MIINAFKGLYEELTTNKYKVVGQATNGSEAAGVVQNEPTHLQF
jgi:YesN/AraC family two-component response regulator